MRGVVLLLFVVAPIADLVAEHNLLPLVDFAYQGLGDGIEEDARGLKALCRPGRALLVASSFSKNFGLYKERVGALTLIGVDADAAATALAISRSLCVLAIPTPRPTARPLFPRYLPTQTSPSSGRAKSPQSARASTACVAN